MAILSRVTFRSTFLARPHDYESFLAALANDTANCKRQTLLSEIRARERKATIFVTLYPLAA
ncbi:hypothetical protein B0H16DRAFT_1743215 [Mycena metata]|uniref:Uncharacterized protein n=1 Tax=Mycena metata TaxID=1033252 RepID=A0AAD7H732_9AGAR|nr:hypothetical protein B0H16DRAFT_1743215 [Mycena metata]